jgi:hypothetical protein
MTFEKHIFSMNEAKDADLALKFMMSVRQTVDAIEKTPLRFPVVFQTIRKPEWPNFPTAFPM